MRSVFVALVLLVAGLVMAIRMLPWWGVLLLFAALVLAVPALLKWGLARAVKAPFKAKGAVLSDAGVEVHAIERIDAPPDAVPGDDAIGQPEYYRLEVTITPKPASGPFSLWEPGEVMMVPMGARGDQPGADAAACRVCSLEVHEDGRFEVDCGLKYGGPQRLRLLLAVDRAQRRLQFRYYFEVFGDVALPAPGAGDPVRHALIR